MLHLTGLALMLIGSPLLTETPLELQFDGEQLYTGASHCPASHAALVLEFYRIKGAGDLRHLHLTRVALQGNDPTPHVEPVREVDERGRLVHGYCAGLGDRNHYRVRAYDDQTGRLSGTVDVLHPVVVAEDLSDQTPPRRTRVSGR